ncbi:acyltransferase [Pseudomonadales bacterium]|nr:acyltransferase [Pseudomonadales bacterium]
MKFNGHGVAIVGPQNITTGAQSYISYNTRIYVGKNSKLSIGDRVSIGHNVRIYTVKVNANVFITKGEKYSIEKDVIIGNDVIIGGNVYIGPGVTICNRVFIGANSVVVKDINESGIYSGIPAHKIA